MRALSPNRCFLIRTTGPAFLPNSLFCNILHVTLLGSGFCPDARGCRGNKPFRMNILENSSKKSAETDVKNCPQFEPKSIFHKILPVSPYGSRFCRASSLSASCKLFRMNILKETPKKIASDRSSAVPPSLTFQIPATTHARARILGQKLLDADCCILYHRRNKFGLQSNEG